MNAGNSVLNPQRDFAVDVVERLRSAGFQALWAGGCVRDDLLGITPSDYDVASTARPNEVISLFGERRTVAVGASFGVVVVLGPDKASGQVEVATFRSDGEYLDGRRPTDVTFCSPEEDAKRRDFTINGMFFDPIENTVIDYVGGREDLDARIVRAIGDATARFTEDKLRMLRAVRFASTYEFHLEDSTASAIRELSSEISQVSAERIAMELRRMMAHPTRAISFRRLARVGLLEIVFPHAIKPGDMEAIQSCLAALTEPRFEPALAIILSDLYQPTLGVRKLRTEKIEAVSRRLRLSNAEIDCINWLADSAVRSRSASERPLHELKPILADERHPLLVDVLRADAIGKGIPDDDARFLEQYAAQTPMETLNPAPFVNGGDIQALNVKPGPEFARLLQQIRNEQLDEQIHSRDEAIARLEELIGKTR